MSAQNARIGALWTLIDVEHVRKQIGGSARGYQALSKLSAVGESRMPRADDWLACEASSGDRLHPRLTRRACRLDRLGELHDRPSADGAGFIVGAAPGRWRARSDAVTGKSFRRGAGLTS